MEQLEQSQTQTQPPPVKYTPVERRILKKLSDGQPHLVTDMMFCLNDELGAKSNLSEHIGNIRKKLPPDEYIVCEIKFRKTYYRHVILITARNNQNGHAQPLQSESQT